MITSFKQIFLGLAKTFILVFKNVKISTVVAQEISGHVVGNLCQSHHIKIHFTVQKNENEAKD